jgi:hypothetical protein
MTYKINPPVGIRRNFFRLHGNEIKEERFVNFNFSRGKNIWPTVFIDDTPNQALLVVSKLEIKIIYMIDKPKEYYLVSQDDLINYGGITEKVIRRLEAYRFRNRGKGKPELSDIQRTKKNTRVKANKKKLP